MGAPSLPQLLLAHWRPAWSVDTEALVVATLYLAAARRTRGRWPVRRSASFLGGVACLLVALQSGLDSFDDRLLSVHMIQHMLLLLLAPLLLLGGRPVMLVLRALRPESSRVALRGINRLRPITGPVACLTVFSATVLLTHVPAFYALTLAHPAVHVAEHGLFLSAGLLVWWPILDGDPLRSRRLGPLGKMVYLLAAMLPMAIVGAWLNHAPTLAYPDYAAPARSLGISALADQGQAGAIMWVAGGMVMIAVGLWATMSALIDDERRQRVRDARLVGPATVTQPPVNPKAAR